MYEYASHGTTGIAQKFKSAVFQFKRGSNYDRAIVGVAENAHLFQDFLGQNVTLVPAPRSAPLSKGAFWPAYELCQLLVAKNLGESTEQLVERSVAVPKSATSVVRPNVVTHYESITAKSHLALTDTITIIDDVITSGSTLLADASRLSEVFPDATIRAFAFIRTKSHGEITTMRNPCVGIITRADSRCWRDP